MVDPSNNGVGSNQNLALQRTQMASVRTDFALMRTGFSIASFGAGVTELLGRNTWADWTTDLLSSSFILVGMVFVQTGLGHSRTISKALGKEIHVDTLMRRALTIAPWVLQFTLFALLLAILFY